MDNTILEHEVETCNDIEILSNARRKLSLEKNAEEYQEVIVKITERINYLLYELQKKGY